MGQGDKRRVRGNVLAIRPSGQPCDCSRLARRAALVQSDLQETLRVLHPADDPYDPVGDEVDHLERSRTDWTGTRGTRSWHTLCAKARLVDCHADSSLDAVPGALVCAGWAIIAGPEIRGSTAWKKIQRLCAIVSRRSLQAAHLDAQQ